MERGSLLQTWLQLEKSVKINYYFRNPGSSNYSIENVFDSIIPYVKRRFEINRYYTDRAVDIFFFIKLRALEHNIHHITGAVNYLAVRLPSSRLILTVHDIEYYQRGLHGLKKWLYGLLYFRIPLRRARVITAISQFTKDELIKEFKIAPAKITVIPNPLNPSFRFVKKKRGEMDVFKIMQIGGAAHKNLERLIDAVKGLDVKLLLIRRPTNDIIQLLNQNRCLYEFRYALSNEQIAEVYAEADILFFASTYEGFGLPIIEAMAVGTPVITSDISPMKEIAGNAAVLVPPKDVGKIRGAIEKLKVDKDFYNSKIYSGRKIADSYNAEIIAEKYMALYKNLSIEIDELMV